MVNKTLEFAINEALDAARNARSSMKFGRARYLELTPGATVEDFYNNYGIFIQNRMLNLYDDCLHMMERGRVPSACVIARCIMETYAIGEFSTREVSRALKNSGVDKATEVVLKFINSSRIKVEEQDRLKKGEFSLEDYHFTDAAKERLQKELAVSVHIMNAMRFLYEKELKETNNKESMLESMYAVLCEWTHPSQTSLFHAHVPETHEISTSIGIVNLFDNARLACSHAMLLLCGLSDLLENIAELAREIKLKGVAT